MFPTYYPSFNPIKVLFYQCLAKCFIVHPDFFQSYQGSILSFKDKIIFSKVSDFQSYQGSILSINRAKDEIEKFSFQSYQGSILSTSDIEPAWTMWISFNPIKVLFYLISFFICMSFSRSFNPIKVLFYQWWVYLPSYTWNLLSILSRFYFITKKTQFSQYSFNFQSYQGSILSTCNASIILKDSNFQSYQGSILSCSKYRNRIHLSAFNPIKVLFYLYSSFFTSMICPTFNPIKVLFYLGNGGPTTGQATALSILSRFYFIPFLKSRNMLYIFSIGFEKTWI